MFFLPFYLPMLPVHLKALMGKFTSLGFSNSYTLVIAKGKTIHEKLIDIFKVIQRNHPPDFCPQIFAQKSFVPHYIIIEQELNNLTTSQITDL